MRYIMYSRPILDDLSQGSRIKFVRIFRHLSQDNVSDDLGITGDNKRRTMTRYEKGDRNPSKSRLQQLSSILLVNDNLIKQYDFKNISDILYFLLWLEEMLPKMRIDLGSDNKIINLFFNEWDAMRDKKQKMIINYEEYFEWKLNYKVKEDSNE
ncbi:MAG: helix-turn-helix transcriptional regulator [bacterium]|nr:helix-turn-helix transcriptional regulator [bacterium]